MTPFLLLLVLLGAAPPDTAELRPLNGTEFYVRSVGAGEPMIVVHGGPMLEHGYLVEHLRPLAEDHQLIFYDQRLSGRSSANVPPESVRMAEFVADLDAVRASFGHERVHLMGHSWGGKIAMDYAVAHPEHLRSLILLSPMPGSSAVWAAEEAALAERITPAYSARVQAIKTSAAFKAGDPAAYQDLMRAVFRTQFHDPDKTDGLDFYRPPDLSERSSALGGLMVDLTDYDVFPAMKQVKTPTLIVYGSGEPAFDLNGLRLAAAMSNSTLVSVPKSGHFPFVEQPEAFFSTIREFLRELKTPR